MAVKIIHRYTRDMLQARPNDLFLFGDNMERWGLGGQAFACRGEPNAVGLPTLWAPGKFFCNADLNKPTVQYAINDAIDRLRNYLDAGGTVVLPADGIGTGLARLPEMAPLIHDYITKQIEALCGKGSPE